MRTTPKMKTTPINEDNPKNVDDPNMKMSLKMKMTRLQAFLLKGDIHSFVSSTNSFLCDIGEI